MLKELDKMSIGQKLYNYECNSCRFEKGVLEFLIQEFMQDVLFGFGAVASLENESMPVLVCSNCGSRFEYKKTDDR